MNRRKLLMWGLAVAALATALLPMLRLVRILASAGVDVPSNDETTLLPKILGPLLAGHYDWLRFPRQVFVNGHLVALPALVYMALAKYDHFQLYPVIFVMLLLGFVKLLLFYDATTFRSRNRAPIAAAVLLPLLAALVYSVTQMSVFEYPMQAMNNGFGGFGLAIGIWGLTRWPERGRGVALAVAGGLIASFSYANGLALWFIFPGCMMLLGFRRRAHFAPLIVAGLASIALYAYIILYYHPSDTKPSSVFNPSFVVAALGRFFMNGLNTIFTPNSFTLLIGALGLVLLILELVAAWRQIKGDRLKEYVPALAIGAFGLFSLIQVSMFRTLIAPWYTGFAGYVWIAVAELAYLLWTEPRAEAVPPKTLMLRRTAAISVALVVLVLFLYSNRAYSDKSFLLRNRAPVSAACLRYFRSAPTYCQQYMASWTPGRVSNDLTVSSMGPFLEANGLSVFSPHQEVTLQGDSIMDSVRYLSGPLGSDAGWATGLKPDFRPFADFLHLNLFLSGTAKVEWTVTLPKNAATATFISAAATPDNARGKIPELHLYNSAGQEQQIFSIALQTAGRWYPFSLPLDQYRGQTVTLRLDSGGREGWTVYNYPRIEVDAPGPIEAAAPLTPIPSNTDLSPSFQAMSPEDFKFDLTTAGGWTVKGLQPAGNDWTVTSNDPSITNVLELNVPLEDYSSFFIKIAASSNQQGSFYAVPVTRTGDQLPVAHQLEIPLLADSEIHAYTAPLRFLNLSGQGKVRLVGISLHPILDSGSVPADAKVKIAECGLIRVRGGAR